MKRKSKVQGASAAPKPTGAQRRNMLLLVLGCLLAITAVWAVRIPRSYVNIFLDHYKGSAAVVSEMKGVKRSDGEQAALLPLQQAFDDWKQTHLRDEAQVTADDGALLRGGLYDAGGDVSVVLLHSFDGSSTQSDYLFVPYYADLGYNVLLPDSRSHGESGGGAVTYGLLEGDDVACWVRWLAGRYGAGHRVILHGDTLGASAALAGAAVLAQDGALADCVRFVVAESPVTNLYDSAGYLLGNQFKLPGLMLPICDLFAKSSLGGRSMRDVDLAALTAGGTAPALVIQGTADTVVDPAAVRAFCADYAGQATLLELDSAHGMAYAEHTRDCLDALDAMLEQYP